MTATADPDNSAAGLVPMGEMFARLRTDPFLLFMFLSLLFIGADRFALHVGITLRVVFPVMMVAFGFLYLQKGQDIAFNRPLGILFSLLAIVGCLSSLKSIEPAKSIGYTIWVLFDFFVIVALAYNFSKHYPPRLVLSIWFLVFRFHALLMALEMAANILRHHAQRPQVWFYEPSYLAIFMTGYFGASLYLLLEKGRRHLPDMCVATGAILAMGSATGIFGMLLAVLFNIVVARQRLKLILFSLLIGAVFFAILYAFFQNTPYYYLIVGFLFEGRGAVIDIVLDRAGNRWLRLLIGLSAFQHNPWLGVGIGGDSAYMEARPIPEGALPYVHPWSDADLGQPFCNIFVEVLGTMGILGFIPFICIFAYAGLQLARQLRARTDEAVMAAALFVGFFSTVMALQLDGTMLRYYLWSPLGLALGAAAGYAAKRPASVTDRTSESLPLTSSPQTA